MGTKVGRLNQFPKFLAGMIPADGSKGHCFPFFCPK